MSSESKAETGPAGNIIVPLPWTERGRNARLSASDDGKYVLYGAGRHVVVREIENPGRAMVYGEHTKDVTAAAMSHNNQYVCSGDAHGNLRVWSFTHEEHLLKLETPAFPGAVEEIAWGPENKRIVVCGNGGSMARVFTWDSGSSLAEIVPHEKAVLSCAFRQVRPWKVALASEDNSVTFYGGPPFKSPTTMRDHSNFVNAARFSPDGALLATAGSDKKVYLYSGETGEKVGKLKPADGHAGSVYGAAFSPDSARIATAGGDKAIKVWNVESKRAEATTEMGKDPNDMQVACLWTPGAIVTLSLRGDMNVFAGGDITKAPRVTTGGKAGGECMAMEGGTLVTGWGDGSVVLHKGDGDTFDSRRVGAADGAESRHAGAVSAVAVRGGRVASGGPDNVVNVGDAAGAVFDAGAQLAIGAKPRGIALSDMADTTVVITNGALKIFVGGAQKSECKCDWEPKCLAVSGDGTRAAVGGADMKVHFFTIAADGSATESATSDAHTGGLTAAAFAPDGKTLATGDAAREVRVYDCSDMSAPSATIKLIWTNHASTVNSVAWSPDGSRIASGGTDCHICIFDPATKKNVGKIDRAHLTTIVGVAWEDNETLWSFDADGIGHRRKA